jgi:hypothetical protein
MILGAESQDLGRTILPVNRLPLRRIMRPETGNAGREKRRSEERLFAMSR